MITIGYFHGANRELEEKTGLKHGSKYSNGEKIKIINKILKSGLSIMIKQSFQDKYPCHNYLIYIDDGNFT